MDTISTIANSAQFSLEQSSLIQSQQKFEAMQRRYLDPTDTDHAKLKQAAQDMEGMFVKQLLDAMDKTVDRENGMLNAGAGEDYFRDMMYGEIATRVSHNPVGTGYGLAEAIYRQMENSIKVNPLSPKATLTMPGARPEHAEAADTLSTPSKDTP
ncbi:MAG: rod-binding protein [Candidatus Melainabacteria bacterium]